MLKAVCEKCGIIFMDEHPVYCPHCKELVSVYEVDFKTKRIHRVEV